MLKKLFIVGLLVSAFACNKDNNAASERGLGTATSSVTTSTAGN